VILFRRSAGRRGRGVAWVIVGSLSTLLLAIEPAAAGTAAGRAAVVSVAERGTVDHVIVHGKGLEGNLEGDSPDRDVSIYLPPSYKSDRTRRYPVLYLLHGFQQTDADWYRDSSARLHVPSIMDRAIAAGTAREMIIVTPNAMTVYGGSNYSSGATTGDWENFIALELVAYIDSHYRTIAKVGSRGLAGHSMGGYGAMRIGMKHPDVFSTLYFMSPCCVSADSNIPKTPEAIAKFEAIKAPPADFRSVDESIRSAVAAAASWAPNPAKPPLFFDSPYERGVRQDTVVSRMTTNRPLEMIDQYVISLRRQVVAFDVGNRDPNIASNMKRLDQVLSSYGIKYMYELYDGNHTSEIPHRFEYQVLPYFGKNLINVYQKNPFKSGAGK
jgi:enterochelin esterase-like enzyme